MQRVAKSLWLVFAVVPLLLLVPVTHGQDDKPSPQKKSATAGAKKGKRAYRGRLPNGWPKLNLSGEQRKKIYALQIESRKDRMGLEERIVEVRKQLDALRDELKLKNEDLQKNLLAVLTDAQREKLVEIEAEAKKQAERRRKERANKKEKDE